MDDPWGSPWASTDAHSDNDPPSSSQANIFLSPPPKAFFGNGSSSPTQSPWAGNHEEDGFGTWTTTDQADGADNQNDWGAWGDSSVQPPRLLSPRLSSSGKESPLAWPENAAASPVFLGTSRSRTPSILRHNSPDPWATEISLTNRSDVDLPNFEKKVTSDIPTIEARQAGEASPASLSVTENGIEEVGRNITDGVLPTDDEFASKESGEDTENSHLRPSHDIAYGDAIIGSRGDPAAHELPSRPSSTCTIDSHDGVERQDSPITSIDEDRGGRIRNNLRTTSGKVQELVGKFDGLARAVSEEPPAISRRAITRTPSREKSPGKSEIEDENGIDFGDFKDSSASDDNAARLPSEASFSSEPLVTPKAETKELFIRKLRHEGEEDVIKTTEAANVQHQDMANKSPGISFDTNIASVDKLFPTLTGSLASSSTEDWEATDYSFSDNFTEISERKSWYRISRYGSMRKHNSGDDENYHRVTWPTSQLHSDTIKIVRRWMEEDSYAGKATLGGTKRTGFFNWDSDAAPVQLDEVFRRKKSVSKHVRTKSIPANNAIIQAASVNERPYRNSTGISFPVQVQSANEPIMPAPSFGWNSETSKVPVPLPAPAPAPAPAPMQASTRHSIPIQPTFTDEDGDDWGEMVSSPCATEEHTEPTVSALPLVSIPTESHEPTPQLLPTAFHNDQPTALESSGSQNTLPTLSDPWLFSDISVLDKPKRGGEPPKDRASQTWEDSTVLETLSLPKSAPLAELGHGSSVSYKTPSENMIAGAAVVTAPSASEPSEVTEMTASAIKLTDNDNQDDVIVQKILQSLPDLSYMIR